MAPRHSYRCSTAPVSVATRTVLLHEVLLESGELLHNFLAWPKPFCNACFMLGDPLHPTGSTPQTWADQERGSAGVSGPHLQELIGWQDGGAEVVRAIHLSKTGTSDAQLATSGCGSQLWILDRQRNANDNRCTSSILFCDPVRCWYIAHTFSLGIVWVS